MKTDILLLIFVSLAFAGGHLLGSSSLISRIRKQRSPPFYYPRIFPHRIPSYHTFGPPAWPPLRPYHWASTLSKRSFPPFAVAPNSLFPFAANSTPPNGSFPFPSLPPNGSFPLPSNLPNGTFPFPPPTPNDSIPWTLFSPSQPQNASFPFPSSFPNGSLPFPPLNGSFSWPSPLPNGSFPLPPNGSFPSPFFPQFGPFF